MALQKDFDRFLSDIEPSPSTVSDIKRYHTTLREYLEDHESFGEHVLETFLSGSYARHTMVRPVLNDGKRDVDVDVVTNYTQLDSPKTILEKLEQVLSERAVYGKLKSQTHSVGIEMGGIDIDVVPLIEDSSGHLFIGNRDTGDWIRTDPKGHAEWTTDVNKDFDECYKPLVKVFKWWRRENAGDERFPKGITLEKIIADNLPEQHESTEQDFLRVSQTIVDELSNQLGLGVLPFVQDPTIPSNNLAKGYTTDDIRHFIRKLESHLDLIETEGGTNATWRAVLGDRFPSGMNTSAKNLSVSGYETLPVLRAPHKQKPTWVMQKGHRARIVAEVTYPNGVQVPLTTGEAVLPKECTIDFKALFSSNLQPCKVYWQIVNTGHEAASADGGLRGGFDFSNIKPFGRHERTEYYGAHSIECYVVRKGICVAKSDPFFVFIE